jgi:hypothetical protein
MAQLTVPTKTSGSIGAALTDTRTPAANELAAVHVERIKTAVIDLVEESNDQDTRITAVEDDKAAGPASATDNAIARFDGTTGKVLQNSGATVDDAGNLAAVTLAATGTGGLTAPYFNFNPTPLIVGVSPNRYASAGLIQGVDVAHPMYVFVSEVSPEGVISAGPGSLCHVRYPSANAADGLWSKNTGTGNTGWVQVLAGGGSGDVTGPASSTDNALPRFDGTTGKILQGSGVTVSDTDDLTVPGDLTVTGQATIGTDLTVNGGLTVQAPIEASPNLTGSSPNRYGAFALLTDFGSLAIAISEVSPEGVVTLDRGSICLVRYPAANASDGLWIKATGTGNTGWVQAGAGGGVTDHGALTGLGDDDHTQYLRVDGTRPITADIEFDGNGATSVGQLGFNDATALTGMASAAPSAVGVAAVGVSDKAARSDHVHAHGNQAGGSLHADATSGAAGFMPAADKAKLDLLTVASSGGQTKVAASTAETTVYSSPSVQGVALVGGAGSGVASGGDCYVEGGETGGAGAGDVLIGTLQSAAVAIGKTGITTTIEGTLVTRVTDRTVSTDVSISNTTDEIIRVDASGGNRILTLPDPAGKRRFLIKKTSTGTNTISLARFGTEQIEGTAATHVLTGSDLTTRPAWMVWSDGTNWWVA